MAPLKLGGPGDEDKQQLHNDYHNFTQYLNIIMLYS
jgi:hypothetical protein